MRKEINHVRTLGVPNGTQHVRGQSPVFWSTSEYVQRTEEYAQHTRLGWLGWVESDGLLTLTFNQV